MAKRSDRKQRGRDERDEWTVFEAMVEKDTGRPFVKFTAGLGTRPVFSIKLPPDVCTAMGLRAVQAAIEAERDAGFVAFVAENMAEKIGVDGDEERKKLAAVMLAGLRDHREQFDAEAGSMRPLDESDPSFLSAPAEDPECECGHLLSRHADSIDGRPCDGWHGIERCDCENFRPKAGGS